MLDTKHPFIDFFTFVNDENNANSITNSEMVYLKLFYLWNEKLRF